MRALTLSLAVVAFVAVGCGSSDESPGVVTEADTGVKTDSTAGGDTGTKADSTLPPADTGTASETGGDDAAGIKCGSAVCGMGEVCCATGNPDAGFMLACSKGACPDGGSTLACDGPEDCPAGAKTCCAEVVVEGTLPDCTFNSGVADCRATCNSNIPTMCGGSKATVRRCHAKADCTEPGYAKCCLFKSGGTEAEFCASDIVALAADSCK